MKCNTCGASLPPGAAVCPVCSTPTPYNVAPGSGSSPQYDPTVLAPQPQYGPTPTAYGAPPPPDPYSGPSSNPYGAPVPQNQYGVPPQQDYGQYGAPPPLQNQYGAPPQQDYGQYGQPGTYGGGIQTPPPKPRSRVGLIIGIVAAVLVLACLGICGALYAIGRSAGNTVQATVTAISSTPTTSNNVTPTTSAVTPTTSTSGAPSGLSIDPTAAGYITNPRLSSAVDSNYNPTNPTTTFKVNQPIYATFRVEASAPEGYITAKWYSDGKYAFSSSPPLHSKGSGGLGYLAARYNIPTNGTVELYFCSKSDCSDARLAQVVTFTVSSTSMQGTAQPVGMLMDMNSKEV